jgi:hypothetical protein
MYNRRAEGRAGSAKEMRRESPPTEDSLERFSGVGMEGRRTGMGVRRPVLITGGGSDCGWFDLTDVRDFGRPLLPDLGLSVLVNGTYLRHQFKERRHDTYD